MRFDKVIINPPYNYGGQIIKCIFKVSKNIVVLSPLSCFKHFENYKHIQDIEIVDSSIFNDAEIANSLVVAYCSSQNNNKEFIDYLKLTWNPKYMPYYEYNIKHKWLVYRQVNNKTPAFFDMDLDFLESGRLGTLKRNNMYYRGNTFGYNWNVHKKVTFENTSMCALMTFPNTKAKENFITWAYSDKNNLANKTLAGLNIEGVGAITYVSVPQIDWTNISNDELWKQNKYDEAVLKAMGLETLLI